MTRTCLAAGARPGWESWTSIVLISVDTCWGVKVATFTLWTAAEICGVNCDTVVGAEVDAPAGAASPPEDAPSDDGGAALGLAG